MLKDSEPRIMHEKKYRTFCIKCRKMIRPGQQYKVCSTPIPFRRKTKYQHWHFPECPSQLAGMKNIEKEIAEAEKKAMNSLKRYKFVMFGYWAGVWVHLNRISGLKSPSPFRNLVQLAKKEAHKGC